MSAASGRARRPALPYLLLGGALLIWGAMPSLPASAQEAGASPEADNAGLDFFRPPPNLFQPMYQDRTTPGSTQETTTETLNFRFDHSMSLAPLWILALRTDVPLVVKNNGPGGDFTYGTGDADFQAALIHNVDQRFAFGFGARLTTPTAEDSLGSGKWQIMPIGGIRYALPEINSSSYAEPIVRYEVSFAGDPTRRNISNLQFAPTVNFGLPDRWFLTLYPSADIRWNFGDPATGQTGRLFLPFDARIGRKLSDNVALSLEIGVPIIKDYPVYDFKTQIRLNVTF